MKIKKRAITLIEIMIVMFLIAMITGVVAYNYRGSLDEGKLFKTKAGKEKLETILTLYQAEHPEVDIEAHWQDIVRQSLLVKNSDALIKDGWGQDYDVQVTDRGVIEITSSKLKEYDERTKN